MPLKGNEIDLEENKAAYEKKLGRELKDTAGKVKELLKVARKRGAEDNTEVKRFLDELQQKQEAVWEKYEALKKEENDMWPEGSRDVSGAYKELQDLLETAETKIKPK